MAEAGDLYGRGGNGGRARLGLRRRNHQPNGPGALTIMIEAPGSTRPYSTDPCSSHAPTIYTRRAPAPAHKRTLPRLRAAVTEKSMKHVLLLAGLCLALAVGRAHAQPTLMLGQPDLSAEHLAF